MVPFRLGTGLIAVALAASGHLNDLVAQQPYKLAAGFGDSARVTWSDVSRTCLTPLRTGFVTPASDSSCRVVHVLLLGSVGAVEWHVARYRREVILPLDSGELDSMDLDELVLFAHRPKDTEAKLLWHTVRDRDIEFLDTLRLAATPRDTFLLLLVCLNGTGGCGEQYFRFADTRWRALRQPFAKALQARLPADHWLHKGRRLDLATLTGVWPVAAPGDGNCCPSLELPFTLRLVGDDLVLVDAGPLRPAPER